MLLRTYYCEEAFEWYLIFHSCHQTSLRLLNVFCVVIWTLDSLQFVSFCITERKSLQNVCAWFKRGKVLLLVLGHTTYLTDLYAFYLILAMELHWLIMVFQYEMRFNWRYLTQQQLIKKIKVLLPIESMLVCNIIIEKVCI